MVNAVGTGAGAYADNLVRFEDTANSYHERLMMAFDMGGPLNKTAYAFATTGLGAALERLAEAEANATRMVSEAIAKWQQGKR